MLGGIVNKKIVDYIRTLTRYLLKPQEVLTNFG